MNNLTIEVYSSGTTRINDPANDLIKANGIRFATNYPGGLYGDASFYIPRDVVSYLAISGIQRVVFRNGLTMVYEGWIDDLITRLNNTKQGVEIQVTGAWGFTAMRRHYRKLWADKRLTDDIWKYTVDAVGANVCTVDRQSRLRFVPKAEAWTDGWSASVKYTMPTGQTVKRITYGYELAEGAQAWEIRAQRSTDDVTYTLIDELNGDTISGAATTTAITASGTGAIDATLGTASQYTKLYFFSRADQTPASDGTVFGKFSDVTVYSETGSIDMTEILKDLRATFTEINSDESHIDSNTYSLVPFIIDRWTPIADIMMQAAGFGDSSQNRWAVGFYGSEKATTPNGEPVLFAEAYPVLTDYDYAIRLDEENVLSPFALNRTYAEIYNYIIVEYTDENGELQQITPEDSGYETLQDTTSYNAYVPRAYVLNVGASTAAAALNSGRRFLAAHKDPQYKVSNPITVVSYIRNKSGGRVPACEIVAGKRIKVENYLQDLSGTGLTFLISHTDYDDDTETCSISIGEPDELIYPRFIFTSPEPVDEVIPGGGVSGGSGGGGADRLNWKRRRGLTPDTPEWDEAVKMGKMAWQKRYRQNKGG